MKPSRSFANHCGKATNKKLELVFFQTTSHGCIYKYRERESAESGGREREREEGRVHIFQDITYHCGSAFAFAYAVKVSIHISHSHPDLRKLHSWADKVPL